MNKRSIFARVASMSTLVLLVAASSMFAACAAQTGGESPKAKPNTGAEVKQEADETSAEVKEDKEAKIMEEYKGLLANSATLDEIVRFIDENISEVSGDNASEMVEGFMKIQEKFLPEAEGKLNKTGDLQQEMIDLYLAGEDINNIDNIKDKELKGILTDILNAGYKVETAEGMFFPVVNYDFYKKYSQYASDYMKEYISLMAVESNQVPAKDAALMIGWDEVLKRALAQEKFTADYKSSAKVQQIEQLYGRYIRYALFGLDNTPLFDYSSSVMDPEAKKAYLEAIEISSDSYFLEKLRGFMDILKKTDYKLTDEVDTYRESIMKDFQK